jgi:hypothetical protein
VEELKKVCIMCQREKLFSEFNSDSTRKDGKSNKCRECMKKYSKEYLKTEDGKVVKQKWWKRYSTNNADSIAAHRVVKSAIRAGKLEKIPCEVCGNQNSEAHHDDHKKQLEIRWLCKKHHIMFQKVLNTLKKCDPDTKKYLVKIIEKGDKIFE